MSVPNKETMHRPRRRPHGGGYTPDDSRASPVGLHPPRATELHGNSVQQELSNRSVHEIPEMYAEVNTTQQDQTHICLESLPPNHHSFTPTPPMQPTVIFDDRAASTQHNNDTLTKTTSPWQPPQPPSTNLPYNPAKNDESVREAVIEIVPTHTTSHSNYLADPKSNRIRHTQSGRINAISTGSSWRWMRRPHVFKHPNVKSTSKVLYRHRDGMGRVYHRPAADRTVDPWDGNLRKLMVQAVDSVYSTGSQQHTWRRTYIRKVGPYILRAAYWPLKTIPVSTSDWSSEDKLTIALRWVPACLALFFVLPLPKSTPETMPGGGYFPFPYRYWGTCKAARNLKEDVGSSRGIHWNASADERQTERILRPRYLMLLNKPGEQNMSGCRPIKDSDWNNQQVDENLKYLPYVFVAYTADQFTESPSDLKVLLQIAEKATRRAGLSAFWISCSCMRDPATLEDDVYRISDVIRGASSLVIAVGPKPGNSKTGDTTSLLREWGSRMWTFPEALLSPNDKMIEIYTRGTDLNQPWILAKKDLTARAWTDADLARELMDHFQGTLTLSRLELVKIAMKCLHARSTERYLKGDMAYALMGLLRRRPIIDETDSEFQALARLSLANDSDLLLERLICILPKTMDQNWIKAEDAWDTNLWDIYPKCQVAAIGEHDTVILDGCRAASITWDTFKPVATLRRVTWKRWLARLMVRISPILIIIGALVISVSQPVTYYYGYGFDYSSGVSTSNPVSGLGAFFLVIGLLTWLASPYLLKIIYGGKLWGQQAWIFGVEGYVDAGTIEALIFGYNMKRLSWSTSGSHLSRHSVNEFKEWVGRDPTEDPTIAKLVEDSKNARLGQQRIFTIVDTYLMTVTLIQAARPPVMVLLCASEGGNQRAVMCSYDWKSQTLFKETVIRMETQVLDRMQRIGRVNFGFFRRDDADPDTISSDYAVPVDFGCN